MLFGSVQCFSHGRQILETDEKIVDILAEIDILMDVTGNRGVFTDAGFLLVMTQGLFLQLLSSHSFDTNE